MKANILGTGLIGASIGLSLKAKGWQVFGSDTSDERLKQAVELGAIDEVGLESEVDVSFVATPIEGLVVSISNALEKTTGIVTDVGSVKSSILSKISDPRFIGGHPMAGNELDGTLGAQENLFEGAVWVLTPDSATSDETFTKASELVKLMGGEVIALPAEEHDRLVAVVSHVPHLTAGALMRLAFDQSQTQSVLMRLAAGGFRDMTRIASGNPDIWLEICDENKVAICEYLEVLIKELEKTKETIESGNKEGLLRDLATARQARISLPVGSSMAQDLVEIRVAILDKPGSVAEVANLASQLNCNIYDIEIVHSVEGGSGTIILVVEATDSENFSEKLKEIGYVPSLQSLGNKE